MEKIELKKWAVSPKDPRQLEYKGQRTAKEVFEELRHRLEIIGYLPDECFHMNSEWGNGRKIPRDAEILCYVGYGGSEGIYLDVALSWYENGRSHLNPLATGKTLGENGSDLDRMFLIASAITKAFHGDNATHARYMKTGGVEDDTGGSVLHLSQQEQQVVIDALVEQRERQEQAMTQTEQLLRRMTGSITAYVNTVGMRPLRMSGYDRTVLAIRDGELSAFKDLYPEALQDHADDLLIEAVGRPGAVGRKMTLLLLADVERFTEPAYRAACKKAIGINDLEKVSFLLEQAERHVPELSPSFHGEMASYAYLDHRFIAKEIIRQCSGEQIAAAPPYLLEQFAMDKDWRTLSTLVEKGISGGTSAARTLYMLTRQQSDRWIAEDLLQKRMWVDVDDYGALQACIENDAVDTAKLLLEGGMDFDSYQKWAEKQQYSGHAETLESLAEHWSELTDAPCQDGPTMDGLSQ